MKRCISIFLIFNFIISMYFPVYADNNKEVSDKEIICNEISTDAICKSIDISRTENPLKSYLNQNYASYSYRIKNIGTKNIEIIELSGYVAPEKAISIIREQKRKDYELAKRTAFEYLSMPFYSPIRLPKGIFNKLKYRTCRPVAVLYTIPISIMLEPVVIAFSVIVTPIAIKEEINKKYQVNMVNNKNNTDLAQNESSLCLKNYNAQFLSHSKEIDFSVILLKLYCDTFKKIQLKFKEEGSSQVYVIN